MPVMSVATSGKALLVAKKFDCWLERNFWAAAWLMCGVAVLSYITASVYKRMAIAFLELIQIKKQLKVIFPVKTMGFSLESTAEDYVRGSRG